MAGEIAVAFAGGLLALLSPCSALLAPAFFAYAFPTPGRLFARTLLFWAGLLVPLVPLGLGAGALGSALLLGRGTLAALAGALLVALGLIALVRGGFALPWPRRLAWQPPAGALGAGGTLLLGVGYGFGGVCVGPILGAILTLATGAGGPLAGAGLLAVYAAGMAAPLFALALVWDRLGPAARGRLRGRPIRIGRWERHGTALLSAGLFIAIGASLLVLGPSSPLSALYAALGLPALSVELELATIERLPGLVPWLALSLVVLVAGIGLRRRRGER